jgi:hypothetical protein
VEGGVQLGPLGTAATNRSIVPAPGVYDDEEIDGMIGRGNRSTGSKTCPRAALSTTNPTCCPDTNPGRRSGKSATNRLSYGTASISQDSRRCGPRFKRSIFRNTSLSRTAKPTSSNIILLVAKINFGDLVLTCCRSPCRLQGP